MKISMRHLLYLILICAIAISVSTISIEWLLTDKSILDLDWKKGLEMGGIIGGGVGIFIWLMYKFNIR